MHRFAFQGVVSAIKRAFYIEMIAYLCIDPDANSPRFLDLAARTYRCDKPSASAAPVELKHVLVFAE
jgi:hypothetical protein